MSFEQNDVVVGRGEVQRLRVAEVWRDCPEKQHRQAKKPQPHMKMRPAVGPH